LNLLTKALLNYDPFVRMRAEKLWTDLCKHAASARPPHTDGVFHCRARNLDEHAATPALHVLRAALQDADV
jgi:hypothetical protein